jgi:hypothetical protein
MGVLVIGLEEQKVIEAALKAARAKPVPWERISSLVEPSDTDRLDLKDRASQHEVDKLRREYPSRQVMLGTYRAAISFELQPAGLFKHLSVSSAKRGMVPNEPAMKMVMEAFGFSGYPPVRPYRMWLEEFEPGWRAINVAELEAS